MNHPERILRELDRHLVKPTRLILYGRAALALGFPDSPSVFHATLDVDAILPEIEMSRIEADDQFWTALEKTNKELEADGLYLTHLFTDAQVILSPDWKDHIVRVEAPKFEKLEPFRPSVGDLILTKMMRVDPQDRDDIMFLLSHLDISNDEMRMLVSEARIPQIKEIVEAFEENARWFLPLLQKSYHP